MSSKGLASRLYRGEAGINVIGKRRVWFSIAGLVLVVAVLSFIFKDFNLGVEFEGGNEFRVPASVGTLDEVQDAFGAAGAEVVSGQELGGTGESQYLLRTVEMASEQTTEVKTEVADALGLTGPDAISDSLVSGAWGRQVTERAVIGLLIFLALVTTYLVLRFEWRMAVAAVVALLMDLVITALVYNVVGFEITPSTVIGFLTILGFALYDVVVVFDKVQENTRGVTGSSNRTYSEATNLAVNQTLMRSINTSVVALLPVGGLLFIGAGLLGAGTLKDLSLVLFVGMGAAFFSSIFVAAPLLVTLKEMEPRYKAHTQRVLARRAALARGEEVPGTRPRRAEGKRAAATAAGGPATEPAGADEDATAMAGSAPRAGARPAAKRSSGSRSGRPGGRPGGNRGGRGGKRR